MIKIARILILGLLAAGFAPAPGAGAQESAEPVDFAGEIQPLFAEYCYACHGPDAAQREAGLRLDERSAAFAPLPSGNRPLVAGDRRRSAVYERLTTDDPDRRMPPADFERQPTAEQVERLGRWIDQGAPWQTHWAYTPPRRPAIPTISSSSQVSGQGWTRNPIDAFVRHRQQAAGLEPSPPAEKRRLLRRVTLALTGLPPTVEEVERFLADDSPDAYERVVDRLLASPRYGEHMARAWLDLARYADTHGYHIDSHRDMWRWRDWVIDAYNDNLPFDQFTIEQLAGDLLPDATLDQQIASGFNRNNMVNFEGGALPEEYLVEYVADRVVTTSTVWMAQTMQCSRCHDHKYDPFTQRDFFRLFAYFNQVPEQGLDGRTGNAVPFLDAPTPLQRQRIEELQRRISRCRQDLARRGEQVASAQRDWERQMRSGQVAAAQPPADAAVACSLDEQEGGETLDAAAERKLPITGNAIWLPGKFGNALLLGGGTHVDLGDRLPPDRSTAFSLSIWVYPTTSDEMALVARQDDSERQRGWWLGLVDERLEVRLAHDLKNGDAIHVRGAQPLRRRQWQHLVVVYDGSGKAAGVRCFVDGQPQKTEVERDALTGSIETEGSWWLGNDRAGRGFRGLLDELRIYRRTLEPTEAALLAGSDPIADIVALDEADRSAEQHETLRRYYLEHHDARYMQLRGELASAETLLAAVQRSVPTTMVMRDVPERRPTYVLRRGDYRYPGEQVTAGTPASLPAPPQDAPANRLTLARWLVRPDHPLTARVAVNRYWQHFFGEGLVRTPENFGTRGQPPTHPRLLDWLATEFIRSGWDRKHLHRLIVTSATYRQTSRCEPALRQCDPDNRLLARGPRFRLSAETLRDSALFAAGMLQERLGGPSVYPYQPKGLWKEVSFNPRDFTAQVYTPSAGADLYRRSLYTFWKRAVPPPPLALFDAPNRETCTVQRPRTNTPLQALVLMNEPGFVEAARKLAERVLREVPSDLLEAPAATDERLERLFLALLARRPTAQETALLTGTLREQRRTFHRDPKAARELLRVGDSSSAAELDPRELASWTILAGIVLNLDETLNN